VVAKLQFEEFEQKNWRFYHSVYPMFDTKQLDQVSDCVGTMGMPEVFYGFNHLYIANPLRDLLLEFSPVDALSLSAFAKQRAHLKNSLEFTVAEGEAASSENEASRLNKVD
jgi:hypothetical protein